MPTERFYRLPEVKRQAIREAALKEFARVPFEKVSINQIIRNADISRGSFFWRIHLNRWKISVKRKWTETAVIILLW